MIKRGKEMNRKFISPAIEIAGRGKKFLLAIILLVFILNLISAAAPAAGTCSIVPRTDCVASAGNYILMGVSSTTNSHGELASAGTYNYVLCCNGGSGNTVCKSDNSNKILGLSSSTNAHAETPAQSNYPSTNNVCYGEDFLCTTTTANSCPSTKSIQMVSLSSDTNAHIGAFADYPTKICCSGTLAPTSCKLDAPGSSAVWGKTEAVVGKDVSLGIIESGGCIGREVSVQIKKKGLLGIDSNVGSSFKVTFVADTVNGGAKATSSWPVPSDAKKGDIYYFVATTSDLPTTNIKSNDLTILDPQVCDAIASCKDYVSDTNPPLCSNDVCTVAPGEINGIMQDPNFCTTHICICSWDTNANPNVCKATYTSPSTAVCGNGIQETGEQCDLGTDNGKPCKPCDTSCKTVAIDPNQCGGGCPDGTTKCSDGTCSAKCDITDKGPASCNYDGVCDAGEGCSCSDCEGKQDECVKGLQCTTIGGGNNPACCNKVSDGVCNLLCATVDPDCKDVPVGSVCGNGKLEFGEECDLGSDTTKGIFNVAGTGCDPVTNICTSGSGCDTTCKLYEVNQDPNGGCPEGTTLCNDGKCSLNCYKTDRGIKRCDQGGCICKSGLVYSKIDLSCCNPNSDGICNHYCTYIDPDCVADKKIFELGSCIITQTVTKDCDTEPKGQKTLTWKGVWNPKDPKVTPSGADHDFCVKGGEVTVPCPALIQLPFFDYIEMIGSALVVALVYAGITFKRKFKSND